MKISFSGICGLYFSVDFMAQGNLTLFAVNADYICNYSAVLKSPGTLVFRIRIFPGNTSFLELESS